MPDTDTKAPAATEPAPTKREPLFDAPRQPLGLFDPPRSPKGLFDKKPLFDEEE